MQMTACQHSTWMQPIITGAMQTALPVRVPAQIACLSLLPLMVTSAHSAELVFEVLQPETFGVAEGQAVAWADIDTDGDLDLLLTGSDFNYEEGVGAVDFGTYIAPKVYASYGIGLFDRLR